MTPPRFIAPMLATLSDERSLGQEWVLERKLDGVRCIAVASSGGVDVRLWTRNELDRTARWPAVAAAVASLRRDVVLDGEVVGMAGDEPLGFQSVQQGRDGVALWAFDVLWLDGDDLRAEPLHARRATLVDLLRGAPSALRATSVLTGDTAGLYDQACAAGWEGLIAKVEDSKYVSGRSRDWLKLKCLAEQEVVVGGWTDPRGSRAGLGALLVGVYDESGALRYAGKVGTGFTRSILDDLVTRLAPLAKDTSPFAEPIKPRVPGAHWVEPRLVAQVGFQEWTGAGRLRQPRFLGLREDKAPEEVVRERPAGR